MPSLHLVPSPAPPLTAERLLTVIREKDGRAYRMLRDRAFVLTKNEQLAGWLLDRGGRAYSHSVPSLSDGAYYRTRDRDVTEWDIWIHTIPVEGPSVWEALA